jgi:hypothetical protein
LYANTCNQLKQDLLALGWEHTTEHAFNQQLLWICSTKDWFFYTLLSTKVFFKFDNNSRSKKKLKSFLIAFLDADVCRTYI